MAHWVRQTVYLLLITFSINAAGLTFGREILEDGPTGSESVVTTASATHDKQSDSNGSVGIKACDHSCHSTNHFLGQVSHRKELNTPTPGSVYVARTKQFLVRNFSENPFRPPRLPSQ